MNAIVYESYGSADKLRWVQLEKPFPAEREVLLQVRAAGVNPFDWRLLGGAPWPLRRAFGLKKPTAAQPFHPGVDVAGVVEAIGRGVTRFKPGDAVFGAGTGSFAEFACAKEEELALKPQNVGFDEAAAVPIAALTALQGLRDKGKLQAGKKVLIHGAAGGVGTFAVQIAKTLGAEVTGVCSTRNVEAVRTIGADRVLDYTQVNFTQTGQRYDLILDCHSSHSLLACRRALRPGGIYVVVGGPSGSILAAMAGALAAFFVMLIASRFSSRKLVLFVAKRKQADLLTLAALLESGKLKPVIEQHYPLSATPEAFSHLQDGHVRGKLVVIVTE